MNNIEHAVSLLRENGIPVETPSYGFSVQHRELFGQDFGQCGYDNDSSISLSVNIDEDPPVAWFFRINFVEMAQFIIAAYQATDKENPSRSEIIVSMRALDELYDDTELIKITETFLGELEED